MSDFTDNSGPDSGLPSEKETSVLHRIMSFLFNKADDSPQDSHEHNDAGHKLSVSEDAIYSHNSHVEPKDSPVTELGLGHLEKGMNDFHFHDDSLIINEMLGHSPDNFIHPVNQNGVSIDHHIALLTPEHLSHVNTSNDDVLFSHTDPDSEFDTGRILSFENIGVYHGDLNHVAIANDLGHSVILDASDIIDMGNHLVITGHEMDSIEFQDHGWTKVDTGTQLPAGVEERDGFNTYVHESGAVVHIEAVIHTHFDPHGAV